MRFAMGNTSSEKPKIKIGDMFIHAEKEFGKSNLYILVSLSDTTNGHSYLGMNYPVQLLHVSGRGIFQSFKDLECAEKRIKELIENRELEHISQEEYEIGLIRKD